MHSSTRLTVGNFHRSTSADWYTLIFSLDFFRKSSKFGNGTQVVRSQASGKFVIIADPGCIRNASAARRHFNDSNLFRFSVCCVVISMEQINGATFVSLRCQAGPSVPLCTAHCIKYRFWLHTPAYRRSEDIVVVVVQADVWKHLHSSGLNSMPIHLFDFIFLINSCGVLIVSLGSLNFRFYAILWYVFVSSVFSLPFHSWLPGAVRSVNLCHSTASRLIPNRRTTRKREHVSVRHR